MKTIIEGWLPDFSRKEFFEGRIRIENGRIESLAKTTGRRSTLPVADPEKPCILPGLVDAHVHIESSMMVPSRFARQVVRFGTVATVSDPHEIANVLGMEGISFMIGDARNCPLKIFFTAPSCVPATPLETSGAILEADDLEILARNKSVVALGEMMNFPGVINRDPSVMAKIEMAGHYGLPVDGHAPELQGTDLDAYLTAGITTDHECTTLAEAEEKIGKGMKILIREGIAARNFRELMPLIQRYPDRVMLCTDDCHPDDLLNHHIDHLIRRGMEEGVGFFDIYRAASINPVVHYKLNVGLLESGDPADFILVDDLKAFRVRATFINGNMVYDGHKALFENPEVRLVNCMEAKPVEAESLRIPGPGAVFRIIRARDGELLTGAETEYMSGESGYVEADVNKDILKIVVVNRYRNAAPSIGWIRGFGLKKGAMASTIAHDSHNLIAVGTNDADIAAAINLLVRYKGGIAFCDKGNDDVLPLPVAGLMSIHEARVVGNQYFSMTQRAIQAGSCLKAPFMTLSFMALLVIPTLKMSDRGLFDGSVFRFVPVKVE